MDYEIENNFKYYYWLLKGNYTTLLCVLFFIRNEIIMKNEKGGTSVKQKSIKTYKKRQT